MIRILHGHIDPWWTDEFKSLEYKYFPAKDQSNYNNNSNSWVNQGYAGINTNGGLYDMSNGMPDWASRFLELFDWKDQGVSLFSMKTCDFLPVHSDHYATYRRIFDIQDPGVIWRAIVFLEDWKSGHYFEINGVANTNWKAGDWVAWNYDMPHAAGNFGIENRYTAQITGCIK